MSRWTSFNSQPGDEFTPTLRARMDVEKRDDGTAKISIYQDDLGEYAEREPWAIHAEFVVPADLVRSLSFFLDPKR